MLNMGEGVTKIAKWGLIAFILIQFIIQVFPAVFMPQRILHFEPIKEREGDRRTQGFYC